MELAIKINQIDLPIILWSTNNTKKICGTIIVKERPIQMRHAGSYIEDLQRYLCGASKGQQWISNYSINHAP